MKTVEKCADTVAVVVVVVAALATSTVSGEIRVGAVGTVEADYKPRSAVHNTSNVNRLPQRATVSVLLFTICTTWSHLPGTDESTSSEENDDPDDDEDLPEVRDSGASGDDSGAPEKRSSRGWRVARFPRVSLRHTALGRQCPMPSASQRCPSARDTAGSGGGPRFRSFDGRCNSLEHPNRGAAGTPLRRLLPPHYKDGLERAREAASGGPLPSARAVSVAVHGQRDIDLAAVTHLLMQWGQLVDHDLTASAQSRGFNASVPKCCTDDGSSTMPHSLLHPDCMPIVVAPDDWFLGPLGVRCLEFVRSGAAPRPGCALGPRDQLNRVTAFLDGSAVYGSSTADARRLRLRRGGLLRYRRVAGRLPLLPVAEGRDAVDLCAGDAVAGGACFDAGDGRVNEQPGLIATHALMLRLHNRVATRLAHLNTHWSDERLFQEARRVVGAVMQHITYREFLPLVLGPEVAKSFGLGLERRGYSNSYNPHVNPSIVNAFATAAFRFGHSLVQNTLLRCDRSHRPLLGNVSLHEELTKPNYVHHAGSVDKLLLGMCAQPAQKRDEFITEQLTNHLFQTAKFDWGMDLAALNIQRGRDHGLAPYNSWREACGLQPFASWLQMLKVMTPETQRKLKHIYRDIDDIDFFPGAMAEKPVSGGLVGPTFACIIAQQFSNLRKGDRFWYENGGYVSSFTPTQLQQIRKISLARILCDNLDSIDTIQPFVFLTADNDRNKHMPCEKIPSFDLTPWTEHRIVNNGNNDHDDSHHHYGVPTTPQNHHDQYDHNDHNNHGHDSYHTSEHLSQHDNYKPPLPFYEEPSESTYHHPSYQKPHTSHHGHYQPPSNDPYKPPSNNPYKPPSNDHYKPPSNDHYKPPSNDHYKPPSNDHYKPPNNDYQKPILLHDVYKPSISYEHTTSKPSYNTKLHNNYSLTYIYEFDLDHKPRPSPTPSYTKPNPSIQPTPSYSVIHVYQSVDHVTQHSIHSGTYDHSKPQFPSLSKPHHNSDNYFPDHSNDHHHGSHFSSDSYHPENPHNEQDSNPFEDDYRPPSLENYGPDSFTPNDNHHNHYKPTSDSYHVHKPQIQNSDRYKPAKPQTYKPPTDYRPSLSTVSYRPSTAIYKPPSNYQRPVIISDNYESPKPISDKYGQQNPPVHHYDFPHISHFNDKVTSTIFGSSSKPSQETPVLTNYPKPEIIYTDTKSGSQENAPHSNYPSYSSKPILLKGSPTSYTVIEAPPDHRHGCKDLECSVSSPLVHQGHSHVIHNPTQGLRGDQGTYSSTNAKLPPSSTTKGKPVHYYENYEKPIIIYTSPSSKASGSNRQKENTEIRQNVQTKGSSNFASYLSNSYHSQEIKNNSTKYQQLETSPELPTPGLGAGSRYGEYLKKDNSDEWSFDDREDNSEAVLPDVLYLPKDPDSVRELPRPINETEEELEEDDDLIRSL